jgi:hypothetical protein
VLHFPRLPLLHHPAALFSAALLTLVLGFGVFFDHLAHTRPQLQFSALEARLGVDSGFTPSSVRRLVRWALATHDHRGLPFIVIDKAQARLFAFDAEGRLQASTPVLLGAMKGDSAAVPATPAGRFIADPQRSGAARGLVWQGGLGELVLHEPDSNAAPGHSARRLASAVVDDKRISDGSLHVPPAFFQDFIRPLLGRASVAYVLPEAAQAAR